MDKNRLFVKTEKIRRKLKDRSVFNAKQKKFLVIFSIILAAVIFIVGLIILILFATG